MEGIREDGEDGDDGEDGKVWLTSPLVLSVVSVLSVSPTD